MMSVLKLQSLKVAKEERIKEPDSTFSIFCLMKLHHILIVNLKD